MKNILISAAILTLLTVSAHSETDSCNADLHFIKCSDSGRYLKDPKNKDTAYLHEQCVLKDGTTAEFGLFSVDSKYHAVVKLSANGKKKASIVNFDPSDIHSLSDSDRKRLQLPLCKT